MDHAGELQWGHSFETTVRANVDDVAVHQDQAYLLGKFAGTLTLGGETRSTLGSSDLWWASLPLASGQPIALIDTAGSTVGDSPAGLAVISGAGSLTTIVGARLGPSTQFFGQTVSPKGTQDIFVGTTFGEDSGDISGVLQFGGADAESLVDIVVDENDRGVLLAKYESPFVLGGNVLGDPQQGNGFAVVLASPAGGAVFWAERVADVSQQSAATSLAATAGRIAVAGFLTDDAVIGAEISLTPGRFVWAQVLDDSGAFGATLILRGDAQIKGPVAVALDPTGYLALAFHSEAGTITHGDYEDLGERSLVLFVFDPVGKAIWSTRVPALGDVTARELAFDSQGGLVVAGEFQDGLDLDDDDVTAFEAGFPDSFVMRFARE